MNFHASIFESIKLRDYKIFANSTIPYSSKSVQWRDHVIDQRNIYACQLKFNFDRVDKPAYTKAPPVR